MSWLDRAQQAFNNYINVFLIPGITQMHTAQGLPLHIHNRFD